MRNVFSVLVLAVSFALLVPGNQALNAADFRPVPVVAASSAPAAPEVVAGSDAPASSPDIAWLLAIGFLAAVVSRRLRAD